MFYAPYLTNSDLGVDRNKLGSNGAPAFVAAEETPHALIIVPLGAPTGPGSGAVHNHSSEAR
jgi:hypothetical protein